MPKTPTSNFNPTKLASELRVRRSLTYSPPKSSLSSPKRFPSTRRLAIHDPTKLQSFNVRRVQVPAFEVRPRRVPVKPKSISEDYKSAQRLEAEKRKRLEERKTTIVPSLLLGPRKKHTGKLYATSLQDILKQLQRDNQSAEGEMASDQAYEDFLNKASGGGGGDVSTKESKSYKTKSVNTKVPKTLESVEEYYTSDADEPFEVVSLGYEGSDISADELKSLIGHDADVSSVGEKEFDPQGQYKKVIDAVKTAGDGKAKVFRVGHGATRAEYYVVSVDEKESRVVGLKALSVES